MLTDYKLHKNIAVSSVCLILEVGEKDLTKS